MAEVEQPCPYLLAHQKDFDRKCSEHAAEIKELHMCYGELTIIKDNQTKMMDVQQGFIKSCSEIHLSTATSQLVFKQLIEKVSDLTDSLKNVEKRTLNEDTVKTMLFEFTKDFATKNDMEKMGESIGDEVEKIEESIGDEVDAGFNSKILKAWPVIIALVFSIASLAIEIFKVVS